MYGITIHSSQPCTKAACSGSTLGCAKRRMSAASCAAAARSAAGALSRLLILTATCSLKGMHSAWCTCVGWGRCVRGRRGPEFSLPAAQRRAQAAVNSPGLMSAARRAPLRSRRARPRPAAGRQQGRRATRWRWKGAEVGRGARYQIPRRAPRRTRTSAALLRRPPASARSAPRRVRSCHYNAPGASPRTGAPPGPRPRSGAFETCSRPRPRWISQWAPRCYLYEADIDAMIMIRCAAAPPKRGPEGRGAAEVGDDQTRPRR